MPGGLWQEAGDGVVEVDEAVHVLAGAEHRVELGEAPGGQRFVVEQRWDAEKGSSLLLEREVGVLAHHIDPLLGRQLVSHQVEDVGVAIERGVARQEMPKGREPEDEKTEEHRQGETEPGRGAETWHEGSEHAGAEHHGEDEPLRVVPPDVGDPL